MTDAQNLTTRRTKALLLAASVGIESLRQDVEYLDREIAVHKSDKQLRHERRNKKAILTESWRAVEVLSRRYGIDLEESGEEL